MSQNVYNENLEPKFRPSQVWRIAVTKQCDLICNRLVANQPPNFLLIHLLLLARLLGWMVFLQQQVKNVPTLPDLHNFPRCHDSRNQLVTNSLPIECQHLVNQQPHRVWCTTKLELSGPFNFSLWRFLLAGTSECTQNPIIFFLLVVWWVQYLDMFKINTF